MLKKFLLKLLEPLVAEIHNKNVRNNLVYLRKTKERALASAQKDSEHYFFLLDFYNKRESCLIDQFWDNVDWSKEEI